MGADIMGGRYDGGRYYGGPIDWKVLLLFITI